MSGNVWGMGLGQRSRQSDTTFRSETQTDPTGSNEGTKRILLMGAVGEHWERYVESRVSEKIGRLLDGSLTLDVWE